MRRSNRVVAEILQAVKAASNRNEDPGPGWTGEALLKKHRARSAFKDIMVPAVLCTSVNEKWFTASPRTGCCRKGTS
jgi:hypothetical protein